MSKPVRTPTIVEMRAFCAAVDLGSLGKAAHLLHVSQPALSKRLKALENLACADLLIRSSQGVKPTNAGAKLYKEARKILTQAEVIEDHLGRITSDDNPVRLAVSHTVAEFVLPSKLVEFESKHEHHLSVELLIANSEIVRELVLKGRAEVGIAASKLQQQGSVELKEIPFCEDEVVVAVPQRHPWVRRTKIKLDDFLNTPLVTRDPRADTRLTVDEVLIERDLHIASPLAEVGSTTVAINTAIEECSPVLLSKLAIASSADVLVPLPIEGISFPRKFVLLLVDHGVLTQPARALIEHLTQRIVNDS